MLESAVFSPITDIPTAFSRFESQRSFPTGSALYRVELIASPNGAAYLGLLARWPLAEAVALVHDAALLVEGGEEEGLHYALLSPFGSGTAEQLAARLVGFRPAITDLQAAISYGMAGEQAARSLVADIAPLLERGELAAHQVLPRALGVVSQTPFVLRSMRPPSGELPLAFRPPEGASGQAAAYWTWGAVLVETLTGLRPAGDNPASDWSTLLARVPSAWDPLCRGVLNPNPAYRWGAVQLAMWRDHLRVEATAPQPVTPATGGAAQPAGGGTAVLEDDPAEHAVTFHGQRYDSLESLVLAQCWGKEGSFARLQGAEFRKLLQTSDNQGRVRAIIEPILDDKSLPGEAKRILILLHFGGQHPYKWAGLPLEPHGLLECFDQDKLAQGEMLGEGTIATLAKVFGCGLLDHPFAPDAYRHRGLMESWREAVSQFYYASTAQGHPDFSGSRPWRWGMDTAGDFVPRRVGGYRVTESGLVVLLPQGSSELEQSSIPRDWQSELAPLCVLAWDPAFRQRMIDCVRGNRPQGDTEGSRWFDRLWRSGNPKPGALWALCLYSFALNSSQPLWPEDHEDYALVAEEAASAGVETPVQRNTASPTLPPTEQEIAQQDALFMNYSMGWRQYFPPFIVMMAGFFGWRFLELSGIYNNGMSIIINKSPSVWIAIPVYISFIIGAYLIPLFFLGYMDRVHAMMFGVQVGDKNYGIIYDALMKNEVSFMRKFFILIRRMAVFGLCSISIFSFFIWLVYPGEGNSLNFISPFKLMFAISGYLPDHWFEFFGPRVHMSEAISVALFWGSIALVSSRATARHVGHILATPYYRNSRYIEPGWVYATAIFVAIAVAFFVATLKR